VSINSEITVGNIITAATIAVAAIGSYHALKGSVHALAQEVTHSLASIRELLAIHNARVDRIEKRYEERFSTIEETLARLTAIVERLSGRWDGYERRRDQNGGHDQKR
jgi:flagellar capping protein FliD